MNLKKLKKRLLEFGGTRFQVDWYLQHELPEERCKKLLEQGQLFDHTICRSKHIKGLDNECHANAMVLAKLKSYQHFFGLALSEDGIWRVHSFCMTKSLKTIVETTEPREAYFGIPFSNL